MKRNIRKWVTMALIAGVGTTSLAGCGSSGTDSGSSASASESSVSEGTETAAATDENADASDEEPYTIHYQYLVAQEGPDQDAVEAAVDELAMKELNMHVDLIPLTFGNWNSQLSMMLASGEPLDIFTGTSSQFSTYIDSDYVVNLEDYKDELADTIELFGEDAKAGYVGDFLIGFSEMKERGYPGGLIVRKDIMDELGYSAEDFSVNTDDYSSFDQITELFAAVKEAYPDMVCFDGTNVMGYNPYSFVDNLGDTFGVLENYGQETTVTNWFESDQFRTLCEIAQEWYDAGYSSKDIAVNTDSGEIKMKSGNCFSFYAYVKPNTNIEKQAQTGYETEYIQVSDCVKTTSGVNSAMFCISTASEDPQKAAEFLNWTYTSREFNDLINWGIEGTDWVETDDGMAAYPDGVDASSVGYHNDFGWIYPNQFVAHAWTGNPTDIWDQYKEYNDAMQVSKAYGFTFDSRDVATQEAQLNSVYEQYIKDLAFGAVDVDSKLQEFNDALYAAGLQDVIDAKQEQFDAWYAEQQ